MIGRSPELVYFLSIILFIQLIVLLTIKQQNKIDIYPIKKETSSKSLYLNNSTGEKSFIDIGQLLASPEDTIKYDTPTPLPGYKNPCFELDFDDIVEYGKSREDTKDMFARERISDKRGSRMCVICFPSVYLMGVAKCGSTELTRYLHSHQSVHTGFFEPHFWNYDESPRKCEPRPCDWHMTLLHYATLLRMYTIKKTYFYSGNLTYDVVNIQDQITNETYGKNKVIGDYTAKYAYMFKTQTPLRIYHFTPHTKLLYSLRDPTDRARSHLNYVLAVSPLKAVNQFENNWNSTAQGVAKQVHKLYAEAIEKYENCLTMYCINYCATNTLDGPDFFSQSVENVIQKSLLNGLYYVFLKKQFEIAPRENVLIIDLGQFSLSPLKFMEETLLPFIGLEEYGPQRKKKIETISSPANVNNKPIVTFLPETTTLLRQFYKNSLVELSKLLNGRRFTWYNNYDL